MTRRPTAAELAAARGKKVPDLIRRGLDVLFVGINPGLYSGAVGHHFARPGNRFWPSLHQSGFTDRLLHPSEERALLDYGCGISNIVQRTTARADELTDDELRNGGRALARKLQRYEVATAAFLGVTAYRSAFGNKTAKVGLQDERIGGTRIWLLPNPSGLNAHYQLKDFVAEFRKLREYLQLNSA